MREWYHRILTHCISEMPKTWQKWHQVTSRDKIYTKLENVYRLIWTLCQINMLQHTLHTFIFKKVVRIWLIDFSWPKVYGYTSIVYSLYASLRHTPHYVTMSNSKKLSNRDVIDNSVYYEGFQISKNYDLKCNAYCSQWDNHKIDCINDFLRCPHVWITWLKLGL